MKINSIYGFKSHKPNLNNVKTKNIQGVSYTSSKKAFYVFNAMDDEHPYKRFSNQSEAADYCSLTRGIIATSLSRGDIRQADGLYFIHAYKIENEEGKIRPEKYQEIVKMLNDFKKSFFCAIDKQGNYLGEYPTGKMASKAWDIGYSYVCQAKIPYFHTSGILITPRANVLSYDEENPFVDMNKVQDIAETAKKNTRKLK